MAAHTAGLSAVSWKSQCQAQTGPRADSLLQALAYGCVGSDFLQQGLTGSRLLGQDNLLLCQFLVQLVQLDGSLLQLIQPTLQTLALCWRADSTGSVVRLWGRTLH